MRIRTAGTLMRRVAGPVTGMARHTGNRVQASRHILEGAAGSSMLSMGSPVGCSCWHWPICWCNPTSYNAGKWTCTALASCMGCAEAGE